MNSDELRQNFFKYFEDKGHKVVPSASLLPENDPTVIFTTAGMHPLVPYLLGEKHPSGKRICNIQKCLRTDDIDEVGDAQHLTFFEMMGYWSLGDYFKKESIHYTFDFYTKVLGFDKDKISVTVFAGDKTAPFDEESYQTWKDEIGIPEDRIYKYDKRENWWGPVGETGPCGPCTEMFIDTGVPACGKDCGPACKCGKFVEIGNNVFMEYNKAKDGCFEPLKQKNVDVGLGFERLLMFSQDKTSVFETDILWPLIEKIEELSGAKYQDNVKEFRIIVDHLRAATFAIGDGAIPSNKGAGYVVRRLIRRAIVKAQQLGITKPFVEDFSKKVFEIYNKNYFDTQNIQKQFLEEMTKEENKFRNTLKEGLKKIQSIETPTGKDLFDLHQSFGIPLEISIEQFEINGITINDEIIEEYNNLVRAHQELSRTASAGMFKGGLSDASVETTRLHTAAHLLLESLRRILGDHVSQKGSNITPERLRFDFSHDEKVAPEQLQQVEDLVNEQIKKDLPVSVKEMSLREAKEYGATGVFEHKYGDIVKVYTIGSEEDIFSKEICGGPHVTHTKELGEFKIIKEESSSQGVRRIKAVLAS